MDQSIPFVKQTRNKTPLRIQGDSGTIRCAFPSTIFTQTLRHLFAILRGFAPGFGHAWTLFLTLAPHTPSPDTDGRMGGLSFDCRPVLLVVGFSGWSRYLRVNGELRDDHR
jgi:hypothetical protein